MSSVPEEPAAEEPASPEESSGLSLLHQESKRRAMLAAVLEQEVPTLTENLLEQEQVGGPPQRPLVVELGYEFMVHRRAPLLTAGCEQPRPPLVF